MSGTDGRVISFRWSGEQQQREQHGWLLQTQLQQGQLLQWSQQLQQQQPPQQQQQQQG